MLISMPSAYIKNYIEQQSITQISAKLKKFLISSLLSDASDTFLYALKLNINVCNCTILYSLSFNLCFTA